MDSFNPTTKTQQAISAAVQAASLAGNPDVGPTHLLGALLAQGDGIAAPLLAAVGADAAAIPSPWASSAPSRCVGPTSGFPASVAACAAAEIACWVLVVGLKLSIPASSCGSPRQSPARRQGKRQRS